MDAKLRIEVNKMKIQIGDKIVYKIKRNDGTEVRSEVSTVLKTWKGTKYGRGWYLITHPNLMYPKSGRWIYKTDIIEKVE
jgi:hypothetical protein